jgi:adenosylcobinamide-GDP ribazoletransferase
MARGWYACGAVPGELGLLVALQFLTRLPVPFARPRDDLGLVWFPAVGLLLGGILAGADALLRFLAVAPLLESSLLVVLLLVLTGGLHADGLIDTCDAVFVHATPERRLEIMRDPRAGSFGVLGAIAVLLLKVASVQGLPDVVRAQQLVLAPLLGRWAIVLAASAFPYARTNGLGGPLKTAATPRALLLASVVPFVVCIGLGPAGLGLLALAGSLAGLLGWWLCRLLRGLTGDCYGAICECVEVVVWLVASPLARIGT